MTQKEVVTTYKVTPTPLIRDEKGEALERYLTDQLKRIEIAINNLSNEVISLKERVTALETL